MLWLFLISILWPGLVSCQIDPQISYDLQDCMESLTLKTNNVASEAVAMTSEDEIQVYCLKEFLWKSDKVNWPEFNITQEDMNLINSHLRSLMLHSRTKRQVGPRMRFPRTGFRVRREYRRLRNYERRAFHAALNRLKMSGQYDRFANLHRGIVVTSAHNGPNFLGWHRVYLAIVEEALRRYNRRVSLPYWDSTMDFDMSNPADSIIWSPAFFGNGDGFVTTGPFRNWQTSAGRLTRNVGGDSRLLSKANIRAFMSRCRTRDIMPPTAQDMFDLELAHGGPHVWVGGQMSGLNTAAHDPVFFLHHAFIDYIWEMFRNRQALFCGVNPERDYPMTMGQHAANRPMDGLPPYRNIDGYRNYWTRFWYRYERAPTCSRFRPSCGSPYLRCNTMRGRCVSVSRPTAAPAGAMGFAARGLAVSNTATRARAVREESTIRVGPRFRAPPAESRTTAALLRRGRRSAQGNNSANTNGTAIGGIHPVFGPVFRAPPADVRPTSRPTVTASQTRSQFSQPSSLDLFSESFPLLPSIDFSMVHGNTSSTRTPPSFAFKWRQRRNNDFIKAFIPVQIVYVRAQENIVPVSTPFRQDSLEVTNMSTPQTSPYSECRSHPYGKAKVTIQSNGINYMGAHSSQVEVDTSLPVFTVATYIRINPPNNGLSETMLSAFHECGLMCQPTCVVPGTNPVQYKACTGILSIPKGDQGVLYGTSIESAVDNMSQSSGRRSWDYRRVPRVKFQCSNADVSSWSQLAYGPIWAF